MVIKTAKQEAGIIRKHLLMPLWCRTELHTPPPGAQGASLFLVFQRDEGGKGLEDTGKDEQRAGFWVGTSYLVWVPALKQTQIPQDRSPLLWRLVCTWGLAFSCIFDGDVKVHQQPSIGGGMVRGGEGSHKAGKRKKKNVLLMEMLNSTV